MISSLLLVLTITVSGIAKSAPCCNTPTIWTFKNESKSTVTLSCQLESSSAWTSTKTVGLTTAPIKSGESYAHNWGGDWYSDGMGMIPGKWECTNKGDDAKSKKSLRFSTDWGENIAVSWTETEAKIAKTVSGPLEASKPAKN